MRSAVCIGEVKETKLNLFLHTPPPGIDLIIETKGGVGMVEKLSKGVK